MKRPSSNRKADCTPEEWAAYLEYHRNRHNSPEKNDEIREKRREYNARPEVKARRKLYDSQQHVMERKKARRESEEGRAIDRARRKKRYEENPEVLAQRTALQRYRRTGFTPELTAALLVHQQGRCAVCDRAFGQGVRMCADHCHAASVPRGLLCHHCNIAEGMLAKMGLSPEDFAVRLASYLAKPPAADAA